MLHGFFSLSPEIDAGAYEKQNIYFYWPVNEVLQCSLVLLSSHIFYIFCVIVYN